MRCKKIVSVAAIVLAIIFAFSPVSAKTLQKNTPAIDAFKAHPTVIEIMKAQLKAGNRVSFKSVLISSQSGFAGVTTTELVIMHISSPFGQVNPSTRSIMGMVQGIIPSKNKFTVTSFVALKPINENHLYSGHQQNSKDGPEASPDPVQ